MIIHSNKVVKFVEEIKSVIKSIVAFDMRLKVVGNRFYNQKQDSSYPISIVIYNNKSMLGYFDPEFYELGFHECLMFSSKEQLHNIIKHELAHYMTFIQYNSVQSHGPEFRAFCKSMGWGEEVYRATTCLDDGKTASPIEENGIFRKVQKLMALSSSSNPHEAELALIKSQQLLLKHNIDAQYTHVDDEKIFRKRIMKQKKENAKMRSIAKILETFFVNVVYRRGTGSIYLEILGSQVNLEIAEYVSEILQEELEKLWMQAKSQHFNLSGTIAKNSFFLGIAKGYCNKINALKRDYNSDVGNAVMVIEKKLVEARDAVYKRLSSTKSQGSFCRHSSALGEQAGRSLNINPALNKASKQSRPLIGSST